MVQLQNEGEEIKPGFNFYRLNDPNNFGVVIKLDRAYWIRYSKKLKTWNFLQLVKEMNNGL